MWSFIGTVFPIFPHSITNKEGGDNKSSKFGENNKRVGNHLLREMIPDKRFQTNRVLNFLIWHWKMSRR